jgi:hypothetical protein
MCQRGGEARGGFLRCEDCMIGCDGLLRDDVLEASNS